MQSTANHRWQCRTAPSIGALEDSTDNIWKTKPYLDEFQDTVFFGVYGLNDFYGLWRHKGRKCILWAGSDIQHFLLGYWLDDEGKMRVHPTQISSWIDTYCESYVENEVEQVALRSVGIRSKVVPSFLGKVEDYEISFKPGNDVYTSVSSNDFALYGWDKIPDLADQFPHIRFHLYGNTEPFDFTKANIIHHGRVPKEQMNAEIKDMQGALRLTEFDGASEIIVKAMLWGQYAFSYIQYPYVDRVENLHELDQIMTPNDKGRTWWVNNLNRFPWVC